ncbi:hypothetical protein SISSUDRAFT_373391 [Sistotremastrum suecicum HHB10207 ss-3]|uniref:Secreted protein n=1 Tax=Sistotremastrum suecicum HHB10207 ss-3 TaxID=1314776 RepID=A0A166G017_9AGAM|nr:hypothetical protein SISSUDRAFT_373391 [Sistotremastrum suecicum HHB10207 ss-3]
MALVKLLLWCLCGSPGSGWEEVSGLSEGDRRRVADVVTWGGLLRRHSCFGDDWDDDGSSGRCEGELPASSRAGGCMWACSEGSVIDPRR